MSDDYKYEVKVEHVVPKHIRDQMRDMTKEDLVAMPRMPVVSSPYLTEGEMFITNPRTHSLISDIQSVRYKPSFAHEAEDRKIDELKHKVNAGLITSHEAMAHLGMMRDDALRGLQVKGVCIDDDDFITGNEKPKKTSQEEFQDELSKL